MMLIDKIFSLHFNCVEFSSQYLFVRGWHTSGAPKPSWVSWVFYTNEYFNVQFVWLRFFTYLIWNRHTWPPLFQYLRWWSEPCKNMWPSDAPKVINYTGPIVGRTAGELAIYMLRTNCPLKSQHLYGYNNDVISAAWVNVSSSTSPHPIIYGCIYHPPGDSGETTLDHISKTYMWNTVLIRYCWVKVSITCHCILTWQI